MQSLCVWIFSFSGVMRAEFTNAQSQDGVSERWSDLIIRCSLILFRKGKLF